MSRNYSILYDKWDSEMLQDADNAITICQLWDWLKTYEPEDGKGFMFSDHPNLTRINNAMKYGGHTGGSHAWTMRTMEQVAKLGWDDFHSKVLENRQKKNDSNTTTKMSTAINNAIDIINKARNTSDGALSPLDIAEASRGVPGFEGQADSMKKFSEGKMTYAEMRSLCG